MPCFQVFHFLSSFCFVFFLIDLHHVYQRLCFFSCSFCDFILFYCWINRTKKANKTALFTIITHLLSLLKLYLLFDSCSLSLLVMFLLLSLWKYVTFLQESSSTEQRIKTLRSALQSLVYEYVCRSLFKVNREHSTCSSPRLK